MKTKTTEIETPELWEVCDGAILSNHINQYGNFIMAALVRELTEQDKANLQLMAAAPDLLDALKKLLKYANGYSDAMRKDGRGAEQLGQNSYSTSVAGMAKAAIEFAEKPQ